MAPHHDAQMASKEAGIQLAMSAYRHSNATNSKQVALLSTTYMKERFAVAVLMLLLDVITSPI
jgi:hypothetical protein